MQQHYSLIPYHVPSQDSTKSARISVQRSNSYAGGGNELGRTKTTRYIERHATGKADISGRPYGTPIVKEWKTHRHYNQASGTWSSRPRTDTPHQLPAHQHW
jgi:hypothetical protein